jgi:hypothetical protein
MDHSSPPGEKGSKSEGSAGAKSKGSSEPHPFKWDPADDCETSIQAYRDIAPILKKLAQKLGKDPADLCIYDPYYCQGGVEKNLNKLGFGNVYNKNEDFYACLESGKLPQHDVLMTSPPYSGDHIKRLVEHCTKSATPWIFLMPDYVHRKQYYQPLLEKSDPFFLIPGKTYQYMAVSGSRSDNTHVPCRHFQRSGKCPKGDACMFSHDTSAPPAAPPTKTGVNDKPTPTTPFSSVWHIHLGEGKLAAQPIIQWWTQKFGKKSFSRMVRSVQDIPSSKA